MKQIFFKLFLLVGCFNAAQAMNIPTLRIPKPAKTPVIQSEGNDSRLGRFISYRRSIPGNPIHTTIRYFPDLKMYKVYEEFIAPGEESALDEEVHMIPEDAAKLYEEFGTIYTEQENQPKLLDSKQERLK